jgi:hypothetical protein
MVKVAGQPVAGTRGRSLSGVEIRALQSRQFHQFDPIAERIVNIDAVITLERLILAHIVSRLLQPTD